MSKYIEIVSKDIIFSYRVAIVIMNGDKILVQKDDRIKHLTLPGGRCEMGESSAQTGMREVKEETGLDSEFVKGIGMIENIFRSGFTNKKIHEILMITELKFIDEDIYEKDIINNIEEKDDKKDHLTYIWMNIKQHKNENFKPEIILDMIGKKKFQYCIVNEVV